MPEPDDTPTTPRDAEAGSGAALTPKRDSADLFWDDSPNPAQSAIEAIRRTRR